jgi:hypothetical protein
MSDISQARRALVARVLTGDGSASHAERRAAFDDTGLTGPLRTLVEKVAKHAYRTTDDDIAAAMAAGYTEDQLFELVVCAAIGQATRQHESAVAALDAASQEGSRATRDPR